MPDSDDVETAFAAYLLGHDCASDIVLKLFPDYSVDHRLVISNAVVDRYWDLVLPGLMAGRPLR